MVINPSSKNDIDEIFLIDSTGKTIEEAARASLRRFVRSQDLLAFDKLEAKGIRLTAIQALKLFGIERLCEILKHGSAIIPQEVSEPSQSLRIRREALGVSHALVAKATGVTESIVHVAEDPSKRTSIRILAKLAQGLGLDDIGLGLTSLGEQDIDFAYRLRDYGKTLSSLSPKLVLLFNEASWVIQKQLGLVAEQQSQNRVDVLSMFEPSSNYGAIDYPVWSQGYYLASEARKRLNLGIQPIHSMRSLLEETLGIPLVQIQMPTNIAGGTISGANGRGIFTNLVGNNENVWVRRATLAHELGHLLWDSEQNLRKIVVDQYDFLDALYESENAVDSTELEYDIVEARANAFAIAFLAPMEAVKKVFDSGSCSKVGLRKVMEYFGLSYTSAKFHVWNSLDRKIPLEQLSVDNTNPTDEWTARESFTTDYFKPKDVPASRRGRFAYEVVIAEKAGLISSDTAALWLRCEETDYMKNRDDIISIFA